jgi:hypothetical protein
MPQPRQPASAAVGSATVARAMAAAAARAETVVFIELSSGCARRVPYAVGDSAFAGRLGPDPRLGIISTKHT